MKKLWIVLGLAFMWPVVVWGANSSTPVGNDIGYNGCINFQDNLVNASGQGYIGQCKRASCYTGEWKQEYYISSDMVSCSNGNRNYYVKTIRSGCDQYSGSCTPRTDVKYCSLVVMYDCDKNKDGTTYMGGGGGTSTLDTNNYLKSLKVSPGSIRFNKNTIAYQIEVPKGTKNITVSATAESNRATISINNNKNISENTPISVTVIAENGSTRTYLISVKFKSSGDSSTPSKDTNNYLSSLSLSQGTIEFNKNTTEYTINIDRDVTKIDVNAKAESSKAKVSVLNNDNFNEENPIKIVVTSESGSSRTYTINIKYNGPVLDTNSYLKELKVDIGKLEFNKDTTTYTIEVPKGTKDIAVTATAESEKAKVEIANNKDISDIKPITVTVTAEDGSTKLYVINIKFGINEEEEGNNLIKSIKIDGYKINFNPNVNDYKLKLKNRDDKLNIDVELDNEEAEYVILGNAHLKNKSTVRIKVTALNGEENIYTINIIKSTNVVLYVIGAIVLGIAAVFGFKLLGKVVPAKSDKNYDYE